MKELEYEFEVLDPEYPDAIVPEPQLLVFNIDMNTVKVFVYFMDNCAIEVQEGFASSGMGTITLKYRGESPSSAVTASVNLRKIAFTFTDAQGIGRNFAFKGKR